jgi:hypothetical protein
LPSSASSGCQFEAMTTRIQIETPDSHEMR